MKPRVHLSRWKNAQTELRFREMEDVFWHELWPEPPAHFDVATDLGPTRVYRWVGDGDPIVLLHGATGSSLMWPQYTGNVGGRDTYAVDTIGDVGRSEQRRPVEGATDLAQWLDAVLSGLGIARAHLVGVSYGGYLALNLAARRPERVCSLTLLEPAGVVRVRMSRFMLWGISAMLASWLPAPVRHRAARTLRMPALDDKRVFRMVMYGQLHHRARLWPPEPLTDDQLRSITVPVLLLLGEKSEAFAVKELQRRADASIPTIDSELIPGAGHALAMSHPDYIISRMMDFLAQARVDPI